jgi:hypothetical protein
MEQPSEGRRFRAHVFPGFFWSKISIVKGLSFPACAMGAGCRYPRRANFRPAWSTRSPTRAWAAPGGSREQENGRLSAAFFKELLLRI